MTGAGTDECIPKADGFKETDTHLELSLLPGVSHTNLASANPIASYVVTCGTRDT